MKPVKMGENKQKQLKELKMVKTGKNQAKTGVKGWKTGDDG